MTVMQIQKFIFKNVTSDKNKAFFFNFNTTREHNFHVFKKIRAAWGGEYLGEKLVGDSSMLGLAIRAAVLFE